jgi:hypothetical protein
MHKRNYFLIFFLIPFLCSTLIGFKKVFAKESDTTKGDGNYYDKSILENDSTSTLKNGSKKKKYHHKKKGSSKKNKKGVDQNPGSPQEDVTDQKEVSEQADQSNSKSKK